MPRSEQRAVLEHPDDVGPYLALRTSECGGCRIWALSHVNGTPVGTVNGYQGQAVRRVIWKLLHPRATLRSRDVIIADCNTRLCIEPAHLVRMDRSVHARRMAAEGRYADPTRSQKMSAMSGRYPGRCGPDVARQIKIAHDEGASLAALAQEHQVSTNTIRRIVRGQSYKYLWGAPAAWNDMLGVLRFRKQ